MKILITGFEPFGGESVNPAYEAVKLLPDMAGDIQIVKMEIPTVFGEAGKVVETGILQHQPDAVICVGQEGEPISEWSVLRSTLQKLQFRIMPEINLWM